ncbi:hypothetical protein [Azovibrio restrictus]|uniref:hypothetical protein n=1 Tax=Azovibrio restrictus TaxID=146938 RepID=UPI00040FC156|nr:hypothetical protein [Azovibrio restrictus]MCE1170308.1 hypothetical protein [Azovibrio sp.]MDD3483787.1 hypothetical protein [Azovibrio restrictus]
MQQEALQAAWTQLGERVARDRAFRQRLLASTRETLAAEGVVLPPGLTLHLHENAPGELHVVLPPLAGELSDGDLEWAAGGYFDQNGEWVETYRKPV